MEPDHWSNFINSLSASEVQQLKQRLETTSNSYSPHSPPGPSSNYLNYGPRSQSQSQYLQENAPRLSGLHANRGQFDSYNGRKPAYTDGDSRIEASRAESPVNYNTPWWNTDRLQRPATTSNHYPSSNSKVDTPPAGPSIYQHIPSLRQPLRQSAPLDYENYKPVTGLYREFPSQQSPWVDDIQLNSPPTFDSLQLLAQLEQVQLLQQLEDLELLDQQIPLKDKIANSSENEKFNEDLLELSLAENLLLKSAMEEEERKFLKATISEPMKIDLPKPQTLYEIQQEQLLNDQLFGDLSNNEIDIDKLSDDEKAFMAELGVTKQDLDTIMKMSKLPDSRGEGDGILDLVSSLSPEEVIALTELSDEDLETFAQDVDLQGDSSMNELKVVEKKKKRINPSFSAKGKKVIEKRSTKKSVSAKLKELYAMIDQLEETKQDLLEEVENVKKRAREQARTKRSLKPSNDAVPVSSFAKKAKISKNTEEPIRGHNDGSTEARSEHKEPKNIVKTMATNKAKAELLSKPNDPELEPHEMEALASSMETMIHKIAGIVNNETSIRSRKKRSGSELSEKQIVRGPGAPEFSFLDFGKDDMGGYTEFEKSKEKRPKRDLKSVFRGHKKRSVSKSEGAQPIHSKVVPTYHAPDFNVNPEFLSGRFVSKELPPPVSPEVIGGFSKRHTLSPGQDVQTSKEPQRKKRHLDFLFPRPSPKDELLYFSVSQPKTLHSEKLGHHYGSNIEDAPHTSHYSSVPLASKEYHPPPTASHHDYIRKREATDEENTVDDSTNRANLAASIGATLAGSK